MKITICGSMVFYKEMEDLKNILEQKNHEVKIPLLAKEVITDEGGSKKMSFAKFIEDRGGIENFPLGHDVWDGKAGAINSHFEKIEWCDAILVANFDKRGVVGYVGGNTLIEIGVAFYLKKKIFILNKISSEISYKEEIFGMKPIFLAGNLENI
jgi:hypothetical protein